MRTYGEACGIAHALDLVGERWALLVVRELLLGPKRFTDIRSGLPAASPNVLAQRLRELESASIVRRRRLPPPAGSSVYELTDWGRQLEPIVISLGTWGAQAPSFGPEGLVSVDSIALAFRALFDPAAADGLDACFALRLGDSRFQVRIAGGTIEVERGEAPGADATIETEGSTLRDVLWGGRDLADALKAGDVRIEGDRRAASRFVRLFPQPQPVAAA
jgi:DNA-binding HxlR family transcriptional regulator/putative sterol carrier protein